MAKLRSTAYDSLRAPVLLVVLALTLQAVTGGDLQVLPPDVALLQPPSPPLYPVSSNSTPAAAASPDPHKPEKSEEIVLQLGGITRLASCTQLLSLFLELLDSASVFSRNQLCYVPLQDATSASAAGLSAAFIGTSVSPPPSLDDFMRQQQALEARPLMPFQLSAVLPSLTVAHRVIETMGTSDGIDILTFLTSVGMPCGTLLTATTLSEAQREPLLYTLSCSGAASAPGSFAQYALPALCCAPPGAGASPPRRAVPPHPPRPPPAPPMAPPSSPGQPPEPPAPPPPTKRARAHPPAVPRDDSLPLQPQLTLNVMIAPERMSCTRLTAAFATLAAPYGLTNGTYSCFEQEPVTPMTGRYARTGPYLSVTAYWSRQAYSRAFKRLVPALGSSVEVFVGLGQVPCGTQVSALLRGPSGALKQQVLYCCAADMTPSYQLAVMTQGYGVQAKASLCCKPPPPPLPPRPPKPPTPPVPPRPPGVPPPMPPPGLPPPKLPGQPSGPAPPPLPVMAVPDRGAQGPVPPPVTVRDPDVPADLPPSTPAAPSPPGVVLYDHPPDRLPPPKPIIIERRSGLTHAMIAVIGTLGAAAAVSTAAALFFLVRRQRRRAANGDSKGALDGTGGDGGSGGSRTPHAKYLLPQASTSLSQHTNSGQWQFAGMDDAGAVVIAAVAAGMPLGSQGSARAAAAGQYGGDSDSALRMQTAYGLGLASSSAPPLGLAPSAWAHTPPSHGSASHLVPAGAQPAVDADDARCQVKVVASASGNGASGVRPQAPASPAPKLHTAGSEVFNGMNVFMDAARAMAMMSAASSSAAAPDGLSPAPSTAAPGAGGLLASSSPQRYLHTPVQLTPRLDPALQQQAGVVSLMDLFTQSPLAGALLATPPGSGGGAHPCGAGHGAQAGGVLQSSASVGRMPSSAGAAEQGGAPALAALHQQRSVPEASLQRLSQQFAVSLSRLQRPLGDAAAAALPPAGPSYAHRPQPQPLATTYSAGSDWRAPSSGRRPQLLSHAHSSSQGQASEASGLATTTMSGLRSSTGSASASSTLARTSLEQPLALHTSTSPVQVQAQPAAAAPSTPHHRRAASWRLLTPPQRGPPMSPAAGSPAPAAAAAGGVSSAPSPRTLLRQPTREMAGGPAKAAAAAAEDASAAAASAAAASVAAPAGSVPAPDLEVDPRDIRIQTDGMLGQGAFGVVYRGTYRGQAVAIKVLHHVHLAAGGGGQMQAKDVESFKQELVILSRLTHRNIVRVLGGCAHPSHPFLVMELMPSCLHNVIHACPGRLSLRRVLQIGRDVAAGLAHLHPTIVHRDLKPANILCDAAGVAKISDFGLARCKIKPYISTQQPDAGSVAYMAPECMAAGKLSAKCDVYSFGVLLWEVLMQEQPWAGDSSVSIIYKVAVHKMHPAVPANAAACPPRLAALLEACMAFTPSDRPDMADVLATLEHMLAEEEALGAAAAVAVGGRECPV